jgi:hypothetical protein
MTRDSFAIWCEVSDAEDRTLPSQTLGDNGASEFHRDGTQFLRKKILNHKTGKGPKTLQIGPDRKAFTNTSKSQ